MVNKRNTYLSFDQLIKYCLISPVGDILLRLLVSMCGRRFKALEHLVAIHCRLKDPDGMLQRYTELLTCISTPAMTRNERASAITAVLRLIAGESPEIVSKVYEITRSTLQADTSSKRLWFSTLMHFGEALLRNQDYGQLAHVVRELHSSCQLSDGSDNSTKGTYLLEVYALEIQVKNLHYWLIFVWYCCLILLLLISGVMRRKTWHA